MSKDVYESPLASRYASKYMLHLFSPDMRFQTWRKLWVELARAEHELGLPITQAQVDELAAHITDIDYDAAAQREREVRHDVMAHVYAYGKAAPSAAGIIHLGATSCYVTDNADLILYRDALRYLRGELQAVLANLAAFALSLIHIFSPSVRSGEEKNTVLTAQGASPSKSVFPSASCTVTALPDWMPSEETPPGCAMPP